MRIGKYLISVTLVVPLVVYGDILLEVSVLPIGLPPFYKVEGYNEKFIELGKILFDSNLLSNNRNVSCSSCHNYNNATADNVQYSQGTYNNKTKRNTPAITNIYASTSLMWDGAAHNPITQVVMPLESHSEMDIDWRVAIEKINSNKKIKVSALCAGVSHLDKQSVLNALVSYTSSVVTGGSKFDNYLYNNDESSLTSAEKNGFELFRGKANCTSCHKIDTTYALFSDNGFHNIGIGWNNGTVMDYGRSKITKDKQDIGKFKTPSLRNVSKTAPYMHDGSISNLMEVLNFYNDVGDLSVPLKDRKLKKINLVINEIDDIIAFLKTLDSNVYLYKKTSNKCINSDGI